MRKFTRLLLLAVMLMFVQNSFAQNIRGFYLQDVGDWIGNSTKENDILNYAQGNGFNYILFYDLGDINWSSSSEKNQLAAFIRKAKTQYGILQVGGVVEYSGYVTQNILPYNNGRSSSLEKFDVINLEFEFWVSSSISSSYCSKFLTSAGFACTKAGAWSFAWREFKLIDNICAANGMISEWYLGWPDLAQMQQIASRADRILLSAYRPSDSDIYTYSKGRMKDIASIGGTTKVLTLLSAQSSFMGPWLSTHPQTRPFQTLKAGLDAETASFANNIDLQGYQWFTYKYLPKTMLATASITANGPLSFCPGNSVTLTANTGASYLWSPGGQTTRSINATVAGSYAVRVTSTSGVSVMSSPVVVTLSGSGSAPTVTASGPTTFCPGGSVTLTSSNASSYLWSNGETTQSIIVSNAGAYSVTVGGTCGGSSSPVVVSNAGSGTTPVITASGPTSFCPGGSVDLTSSVGTSYLWSTGETTRTITVSSAGSYTVTTGGACGGTSSATNVSDSGPGAVPTVTTSGPTSFCPGGSVTLTSSNAPLYLWSNGETTQSITVTNTGSYFVTTGGACGGTSSTVDVNAATAATTPVITASGSLSICPGSLLTLTSTAANSYVWSNGATTRSIIVSGAGDYSVSAYSGPGCSASSTVKSVSMLPAPSIPVITPNGSLTLTTTHTSVSLTSSTATAYLWSTTSASRTISVTSQGLYRVTVTGSNGCKSTSSDVLVTANGCTPPPAPTISLSSSAVLTPGQTVTLTANGSGSGWLWSNGANTRSITVSAAGVFTVRNYSKGYCFSTSLPTTVSLVLPRLSTAAETVENSDVNIFPNPASTEFDITFTANAGKDISIRLLDITGKEIYHNSVPAVEGENKVRVDVSELPRGIYLVYLQGENLKEVKKVIVK